MAMKKEELNEAISLTQRFLRDFYQKNPETVLDLCLPDVSWIGGKMGQFDLSLEQVQADIRYAAESSRCGHIRNQEYHVAANTGISCTIIGRYWVVDDEDYLIQEEKRCVVVWKQFAGQLRIQHLAVFSPMSRGVLPEQDDFVHTLEDAKRHYTAGQSDHHGSQPKLMLKDVEGTIHFIDTLSVLYVESSKRYVNITTVDGTFTVREAISDMEEKLHDPFVRVHRRYIINANYVREIDNYEIFMENGFHFGIPPRNMAGVKQQLASVL